MLKNKMLSAMGGAPANYIEDVFSTYLYTGNGSTQTINNGIDLAGEGGLVWTKDRSVARSNQLHDSARGFDYRLISNTTDAQALITTAITSVSTTGFSIGSNTNWNASGETYASWTFRKQPKFMTIATWTGNGAASQVINHDLGSVPGFIIVKAYSGASASSGWWYCYHRSLGNTQAIALNDTGASTTLINFWRNTDPTSTQFTVGSTLNDISTNFIAYVFAHDAGGFGESGEDNVISCGSFTVSGTTTVTLNYEPQYVMLKRTDQTSDWLIVDSMRGFVMSANDQTLSANTSAAETSTSCIAPSSTGFTIPSGFLPASSTWIYIAIRRGPMKTPTTGTSVFALSKDTTAVTAKSINAGFPTDMVMQAVTEGGSNYTMTRLIGSSYLRTQSTAAESALTSPFYVKFDQQNTLSTYISDQNNVFWNFRRAPGFFDVVCRNGTGANATQAHNLAASPELVITKKRSAINEWYVTHSFTASGYQRQYLEQIAAASSHLYTDNFVWTARPTTSSLFFGSNSNVNQSGQTFVDYLFATCPGVSKVGSYTGNGSSQTINCGFTAGARFVLIKRTDSTGAWYVWDSARGIVAGNDPYLLLNSTAAEVTTTDYIDPVSSGFEISSTAPAAINASGGSFIYLAIA